jgi:dihydroorotate dehydrogenase (NAD+) catalytic subunit
MSALAMELAGVSLQTPVLLASGGLGESAETLRPFQRPSVGAVVTRTLRSRNFEERRTFPSPHLHIEVGGRAVLNCEWGNQRGLQYWLDEGFLDAASSGPVIVSISGRDTDDCVEVCRVIPPELIPLVEVNVSCSHAGATFGAIGDDPSRVFSLVTSLTAVVEQPVIVKLGLGPKIAEAARAAEEAGASAISATNSIGPGLDIDIETGRPMLGLARGCGGVSGRAIFPLALNAVATVAAAVDIPVIGIGGISSYGDVVKMLSVGASCVQVYTEAILRGPTVFDRIAIELDHYLREQGYRSVSDIVGRSRKFLARPSNLERVIPVVDDQRCVPCDACRTVCPVGAITIGNTAVIDSTACSGCGACIDVCPPTRRALSSTWRPVQRPREPGRRRTY